MTLNMSTFEKELGESMDARTIDPIASPMKHRRYFSMDNSPRSLRSH